MDSIVRFLVKIEDVWRNEHGQQLDEYKTAKQAADLAHQAWKEQYKLALKSGKPLPVQPDNSMRPPARRRLVLTDATYERLHEILGENPAGLLVVRDELTGWLADMDKQGRESERSFYLQAWNGYGGFTIDRIGRGEVYVPEICVSLLGNIQPARLRWFLSDAMHGGVGDDGLFQRFQMGVWPDPPRTWTRVDRPPNAEAANKAQAVFSELVKRSPDCPIKLRFDDRAQQVFHDWWDKLELLVRGDSLHPTLIAHLSKYRSLMPTLAGLFELADAAASEQPLEDDMFISLGNAQRAIGLCSYLESHARRIYSCIISPDNLAAQELGRHIQRGDLPSEFTARFVYRKNWTGLGTPELVRGALNILEDAGWVRPLGAEPGPAGGRPADTWRLNPAIKVAAVAGEGEV